MSAKFINISSLNDILCKCNICLEDIENDKIVSLICHHSHIFCYDCIFDWYKEIKNSVNNHNNYSHKNICPICRKNGGFLPIHNDYTPIKGINIFEKVKVNTSKPIIINPNKEPNECGVKLKTKPGYCMSTSKIKYGGFCGKHCSNLQT